MTIEPRCRFFLVLVETTLFAGLLSCASWVGIKSGLPASEVDKLPPEIARAYELFAHRCSRCHTLARPLTARIDDVEHWRKYVGRMRRQPASGITAADGELVLVFLEHYTKERQTRANAVESSTVSPEGEVR